MRRSRSGSLRRSTGASCARRATHFLDGLLSGIERKTGWLMAEQAGLDHPNRTQTLIGRSRWEADALRDRVRADVLEALGDPHGVAGRYMMLAPTALIASRTPGTLWAAILSMTTTSPGRSSGASTCST